MSFTSFILVHQNGSPFMINIMDISYVSDNAIIMRSDPDHSIEVDETFEQINEKLCEELG